MYLAQFLAQDRHPITSGRLIHFSVCLFHRGPTAALGTPKAGQIL
jgi:hypothetical protein